jgi:hypothetical protein
VCSPSLLFGRSQGSGRLCKFESLSNPTIQCSGNRLKVWNEDVQQFVTRDDTLFGMGNPEQFVEGWGEANLTSPPVIVILATFAAHEEPAAVDFSAGSED